MIKHFLYSAFFHSLFFLLIYYSLDIKTQIEEIDQSNSNRLVLSTINLQNINKQPPLPKKDEIIPEIEKPEEKKEEIKKAEEPIKKEIEKPKDPPKPEPKPVKKEKPIEKKKKEPKPKPVEKKKEEPKPKVAEKRKEKEVKPKPLEKKKEEPKPIEKKKEEPKPVETPKKEEPKKEEEKAVIQEEAKQQSLEPASDIFNPSQDLENINLSSREKLNIRSQLQRCYKWAISQTGKESEISIKVRITIDKLGFIGSNLEEIIDKNLYDSNTNYPYNIAIDNARRTIKLCSPLRNLPEDKYDVWGVINLEIGAK